MKQEDKTLPEDYFKDTIIKLQPLPKEEWQKKKSKRYGNYIELEK